MPDNLGSQRTTAPGRLTGPAETLQSSGVIRPLRAEDLPDIVALRRRAFQNSERHDPVDLAAYFERIFLRNPWRDEELPSLVYEDATGRPVGFIGVIPRRMTFQGEAIRVAVASQMMVAPEARGITGLKLVRTLLSGPQDLTLSDAANDPARRVWVGVGAEEAVLYGFTWERVLKPWRRMRTSFAGGRLSLRLAAFAARPLLAAGDALAVRLTRYRVRKPVGTLGRLDPTTIAGQAERLLREHPLRPAYDAESIEWLLAESRAKKQLGTLAGGVVRDIDGEIAGWFAHYAAPRRISHVLQFVARGPARGLVMEHLLYDAFRLGAIAVEGRLDPSLLPTVRNQSYRIRHRRPWTLVYSRRPEIVRTIERGDAFLSRLDGEFWLSF